jgi:predicted ATPase/DNA-binding SARP family transcriptional activator
VAGARPTQDAIGLRSGLFRSVVLGSGRWRGGGAGFTMPVMGADLADARLMVALLGPVELGVAGGVMAPVAQPRLRVLLGLLGVAAGRVVSAEALVDGLWGEEWSPRREQNLHALVYQLRRRLAAPEPGTEPGKAGARLVRAGGGYRLVLGPGEFDVAKFQDLAGRGQAAARAGDAAAARELLGQALGLWRGTALADAAPLCRRLAGEAARLEEARLAVIEQRIGCDLALGRHAEVVGELAGLVAEFPLRERLAALLMTALYRSGRRGEALAAYDRARRVLAGELGLDPGPELAGLQAQVLTDDPALAATAAVPGRLAPSAAALVPAEAVPRQLPAQLTSFIGRERDLREVAGLLERDRLVTLAGPGGAGKTRLAVLVAGRLLPQFDDGVFFVPLAPVRDPGMVPSTIASVLGVKERPGLPAVAALEEQLRDRRSLLVLDNFEHLLLAASVVSRLLAAAPQVKALVTSRTLLRIYGEREYVVAPLPVPQLQQTTVAEVESYPAVQLFLDRAGMARPGFALSASSATAVAEICRRLDGLPLAIELAAARIRVLSPGELLGRLGRRLALQGTARDLPERQRTLRATIDWSHQLLDVEEARLFAQLSVFAGGWTRQAAERVCGEGLGVQVLDGLESLVEHSLVQRVTSGGDELRFDMLETIREYARERLDASGAGADLARRHARYFLDLAQDAEPHLTGPQADRWLQTLRAETGNLRSALRWAMDRGDPPSMEIGLWMAASLWRFWQQTGALREARQWLEDLLARGTDAGIRPARALALSAAGSIAYWQTDLGRARDLYQQAVELYRTLGDRPGTADALSNLASVPMMTGDLPLARRLAAQARDLWQELGDDWQAALAALTLGLSFLLEGGHEQALACFEEFLPVVRARGDRFWLISSLTGMAQAQHFLGRFQQARNNFGEALGLALEASDLASVTVALGPLSNLEGAAGDYHRAVRLWAACEAIRQRIGGGAPAEVMRVSDPCPAATLAIGEDAVRCAWAEGWAMSPEQAVRYATRQPAADRIQTEL